MGKIRKMSYTLEMNTPVKTPIRYEFPVYPLCSVGTGINEGALEPLMTALERDNFVHHSLSDSSQKRHIWQLLDGVARGCYTEEATKVAIHLTTQLMQLAKESFNQAFDDSLSDYLLYTKGCIISSDMEAMEASKKTAPLGWFVLEGSQISFKSNSTKQGKPQTHWPWGTLSEELSWEDTVIFTINSYIDKNLTETKGYLQDPAAISFVGLERLFPKNTNSDRSDALNTVKLVAFGAEGKITNWHFKQGLGWADELVHASTNIAIAFQGVRHQAPVSLTNCSFYNSYFSSSKIRQPAFSVETLDLGKYNSKIFNTCAFCSVNLIDRDLNNPSTFYKCTFLEGSTIDIRCPNPRGVYLTNCFGTNDIPSGWKSKGSVYRGLLSIMTSPGQFIDITGIGENNITEVARANSDYRRLLDFNVVPVKAEPVKIFFADLPEDAPLDLTVNGPVQVLASNITLNGIHVKNNNKGQSPFQFTGVDVNEVGLGAGLIGNLGKDIRLSYTKQVDAIGDKPDGFDYSKRLGTWALAQTVGKLNAGMTEENEQDVKLTIQKLREVNQPERKLSEVTPGTKRMAP